MRSGGDSVFDFDCISSNALNVRCFETGGLTYPGDMPILSNVERESKCKE